MLDITPQFAATVQMTKYKFPPWVPPKEDFEGRKQWKLGVERHLPADEREIFQKEILLLYSLTHREHILLQARLGVLFPGGMVRAPPDPSRCPRAFDVARFDSLDEDLDWIMYRTIATHIFRDCDRCAENNLVVYESFIKDSPLDLGPAGMALIEAFRRLEGGAYLWRKYRAYA